MDLGVYEYYLGMIEYHEAPPIQRLSALNSYLYKLRGSLCGFTQLLKKGIDNSHVVSPLVMDFYLSLNSICGTLQEMREEVRLKQQTWSEELAQETLLTFWNKRSIVETALSLPDAMRRIEIELTAVLPEFQLFLRTTTDHALLLKTVFDVFANPGKLDVPDYIIQFNKSLDDLYRGGVGPERLQQFIEASRHELPDFRNFAAGALGNYNDERAVDALIDLLTDDNEAIRGWAAESLGHIKNRKAVPALIQALHQTFQDQAYIGWIANALAEMPDERALDILITTIDNLMVNSPGSDSLHTYPIAGIRKALGAIGGPRAETVLKHYFGSV